VFLSVCNVFTTIYQTSFYRIWGKKRGYPTLGLTLKKNIPPKLANSLSNSKFVYYSDVDPGSSWDRRSTSGYCLLISGNFISWRSKKCKRIAISSVDGEDHAMVASAGEITWSKQLLHQLKFGDTQNTRPVCNKEIAIHLASNPVFHKWTKQKLIIFLQEIMCSLEKSSLTLSTLMTNLQHDH